jgi:hypothetical protein
MECGLGRDFICSHLEEGCLNQRLKFFFAIYPDATMGKDDEPHLANSQIVFIPPKQYELLITTRPKVLESRFQEMEKLSFKANDGTRVYYRCSHYNLIVNDDGFADWEVNFY